MIRKRLSVLRVLEACVFFAIPCLSSGAQGGNRTIAQFAHTAWGANDGAPGPVLALAQGLDGYLWLGTPDGLYRFDGVLSERYEPQSGGPFPVGAVTALLALPDGSLWIAFRPGAISLLRNGKARNFTDRDGLSSPGIRHFAQDQEGTI